MATRCRSVQKIEMEELRRQVKESKEQLARYEATRRNCDRMSDDGTSSDEENSNSFHYSSSSKEFSTWSGSGLINLAHVHPCMQQDASGAQVQVPS
ncbi:hypothetical protein PIB30_007396 [Stylosanthes scabra]|uniref:Uncharacterized protein n=1 Tax=Stylosanthes scabra TaxID=79078 RepID=A0ABU6Z548_9FABA|nr:hypothetical protein [Stylosanthes scabra]